MAPRFPLILLAGLALGLSACQPTGPFSTDPAVASRQVAKLVPKGTSAARAKRVLDERGFVLSSLSPETDGNRLIIGTYTGEGRIWQVGFILIDHHVAGSSVTILDTR